MYRFPRLCLALITAFAATSAAWAGEITVFAAASLKDALDDIAATYQAQTGDTVRVSLAGSSTLARQIEQGAPADIFISAHPGWMDRLEQAGLIAPESRVDLLGNALVLIAHGHRAPPLRIGPDMALATRLGEGRLAMALVDAVPAGIYGKAALEHLGQWPAVADRVVQAENVRAALALVSLGEAPFGIVYRSDAVADEAVTVVGTFPADSHTPIIYPAAAVADSDNPLNRAFLAFLRGDAAGAAFQRHGFDLLD